MIVHLYLAPCPLPGGPAMLLATTPEAAISLLDTGVVTRLSVSEEWAAHCDPNNRVAKYYEEGVRSGKSGLPEWRVEGLSTLLRSPEAIAKQVLDRCRQLEFTNPKVENHPGLSAGWRFDNFTPALENQDAFAFATLASLKNRPERTPLIIFGPSGSGKSHLLHAIGHQWLRFNAASGGRLLMVRARDFIVDAAIGQQISALRKGDCLVFDNLEILNTGELTDLSELVWGLVAQETGLIFAWRGARKEIAKSACHYFSGFQGLSLVEIHGN